MSNGDIGPVPIRCGKAIDGPKTHKHVVAWRNYCRRIVKKRGDRCWQHGGAA